MSHCHRLVAGLLFVLAPATGIAATLHVPSDFATIQAAIDAAVAGDTVLVAPGTYSEYSLRDGIFAGLFLKDGVALVSEGGSGVTTFHLGSAAPGTSAMQAIDLPSMTNLIQGFTITSVPVTAHAIDFFGGKLTLRDCVFDAISADSYQGVVYAAGSLDVIGCRFEACTSGIWQDGGDVHILDSVFETSVGTPVILDGLGGDIVPLVALVERCRFIENSGYFSAAMSIADYPGGVTVRGCLFEGNLCTGSGPSAVQSGGAGGVRLFEDNIFAFNRHSGNGDAALSLLVGAPITVIGNTFYGNSRSGSCAGVRFQGTHSFGTRLERNILAGCMGGVAVTSQPGVIVDSDCNVFWQNDHGNAGGTYALGATDREINPDFCDAAGQDFTVAANSPCLPPYSLGCDAIGALGAGCGAVAVAPGTWGKIKSAYR